MLSNENFTLFSVFFLVEKGEPFSVLFKWLSFIPVRSVFGVLLLLLDWIMESWTSLCEIWVTAAHCFNLSRLKFFPKILILFLVLLSKFIVLNYHEILLIFFDCLLSPIERSIDKYVTINYTEFIVHMSSRI